jgi:hypothetical protein
MSGVDDFFSKRLSPQTLVALLSAHIDQRSPFSLVRLGDGEGRVMAFPDILPGNGPRGQLGDSLNIWFGDQAFADSEIFGIRDLLMSAVLSADIVGLPTYDQTANVTKFPFTHASYRAVLDYFPAKPTTVTICDTGIAHLLQFGGFYGKLLAGLPFCGLVSSRSIGKSVSKAFGIPKVQEYIVPGESKFPGQLTGRHYPDVFKATMQNLHVPYKGAVFLVGAGVLGKIYCNRIKQLGGIAIDIGSVFDGWSRVPARNRIRTALRNKAAVFSLEQGAAYHSEDQAHRQMIDACAQMEMTGYLI